MSFNNFHHLKPKNLENKNLTLKTIFGFDFLGNCVPIEYYQVAENKPVNPDYAEVKIENTSADCIDATITNQKRQTGGIISAKNFPSR